MEKKIKIIDEIVKRHPACGVEKGWSYYVGGMKDTGDWYFRKMLDVPIEELCQFLYKLKAEEGKPVTPLTEQELADTKIFHEIKDGDKTIGVISEYQMKLRREYVLDTKWKMLFGTERPKK